MRKSILTLLIQFGFGKNYSYGKWEKLRVVDIISWKFRASKKSLQLIYEEE